MALQLFQAKNSFLCKTPSIGLKTTPEDLEIVFEEIDTTLANFQTLYTCFGGSVKAGGDEVNLLEPLVKQCEADIFLSYVKPDIPAVLGKKFSSGKTVSDLKQLLIKLIGQVDPTEKMNRLKSQFGNLARRANINESFGDFIDRLIEKAEEITESEYSKTLAADQWTSDLRPMDKELLDLFPTEWNKADLSLIDRIKAQAATLDTRKMFKKIETSSHKLEIDAIRFELGAKVDFLAKKLEESAIRESEYRKQDLEYRERQDVYTKQLLSQIRANSVQVHTVEKSTPKPEDKVEKSDNQSERRIKKQDPNLPWLQASNYCFFCGGKRCKKGDKCDGNPGLYCMFCQKHGHAVTSAHFHGNSKN